MTDYATTKDIQVEKKTSDYNSVSYFSASFDNQAGIYSDEFELNQEVQIFAEADVYPPTTQIFTGIIEDIDFSGRGTRERLTISGRDYGAILQDKIVEPRIFKNAEVSEIVTSIMSQNISSSLITTNNVNVTTTTIDKITFSNQSVFEVLSLLAEESDHFFYVDIDKDLHFEPKESVDSGITLDNTNVLESRFRTADQDIFNLVTVYGDTQLTGNTEEFTMGTGSVFNLEFKPRNTKVFLSGAVNTQYQPGGVLNINDPSTDDTQFLVDFQSRNVVLTSGTTAGDNIPPAGSVILISYEKDTQIIRRRSDPESRLMYGPKDKTIIDKRISDPEEATAKAITFLAEHKDPRVEGTIKVKDLVNVTPGEIVTVNLPNQNISNRQYKILSANYDISPQTSFGKDVLTLKVNNKVSNFVDIMADQMKRIRSVESAQIEGQVTNLQAAIGSVGVSGTAVAFSRNIGSAFYFHTPNHNILNSPTSLLGDVRGGSTVFTLT